MLDEHTARQVDLASLRRAPLPRSPAGQRLRDTAAPFAPDRHTQAHQRVEHLRALENALLDDPALEPALEPVLQQLGDPRPALDALLDPGPPSEATLFAINALLRAQLEVRHALRNCPTLLRLAPEHDGRAWLDLLHAGATHSWRFRLRDEHHPDLAHARNQLRNASRARVDALTALRDDIETDYAARVSAQRQIALPDGDPRVDQALDDPRLERLHASRWEHLFSLVPPPETRDLEREEDVARTRLAAVEARVRLLLADPLRRHHGDLEKALAFTAGLDLDLALVQLRRRWDGCWPSFGDQLRIRDGRLPAVEQRLSTQGIRIQPVSLTLPPGTTLLVGPNMGGKTQTLTLAATLQWLGQMAWPTPAAQVELRPVDRIAWVGGTTGSLRSGLSRFGAEMDALAQALRQPGTALLLLDEPGSATNPAEGAALARAIADHLHHSPHTTLLATHFPRLRSDQPLPTLRVAGLDALEADDLRALVARHGREEALQRIMDFTLLPERGDGAGHDALRIAAAFDLPDDLLRRAAELLDDENPR
ncbi:MAG: hypothetical protein EA398_12605 [Deltaproteobacteria bacterium]|nr:MAG: hypothetical protein EA398_12605 [Deltaproteobacteria bacterium]